MEKFKQMFNQLGRTEKSKFISENIELAYASAIAKYIQSYLFDVLLVVDDDEYIATYLRDNGYLVTASEEHLKAFRAFEELVRIADAWNKADGFVPDFSNRNQPKWFTWFAYDTNTEGFVYAATAATATHTTAHIGSRICFKSSERATQFGKQFIDLWNDFLFFRE